VVADVHDVVVSGFTVTSMYDGPLGEDTDDEDGGGGPVFGVQLGQLDGKGNSRVLIGHLMVTRFQRHGITVKASREVTVQDNHVAEATSVGPGGWALVTMSDAPDVPLPIPLARLYVRGWTALLAFSIPGAASRSFEPWRQAHHRSRRFPSAPSRRGSRWLV
jgi:hypothetical protein